MANLVTRESALVIIERAFAKYDFEVSQGVSSIESLKSFYSGYVFGLITAFHESGVITSADFNKYDEMAGF